MTSPSEMPQSPRPEPQRRRRRLLTYLLVGTALLSAAGALAARRQDGTTRAAPSIQSMAQAPSPAPAVAVAPGQRPRVEMVFALDTTGSMGGLIEGAKRKIWSLASFVAQGQPTPDLRIGLVGYRDRGDDYVTRRFDLDDDLDRVFKNLHGFSAEGGGDMPEHVSRALSEAVNKMSWSSDPSVVKVIYLVGDSPPHTDYQDGYNYRDAAVTAARRGIEVHTVRCGDSASTEKIWRTIAQLGHGQYSSVAQSGGMREEDTPYDEELAKLHDELSGTALAYGAHRDEVVAAQAAAAAAPAPIKAARVGFVHSKGKAVSGKGDLLDDLRDKNVKLEELAPEALPAELKGLAPAAQAAVVASRNEKRQALDKRIDELTRLRAKHIEEQERKAEAAGDVDAFDVAAKKSLRGSVKSNVAAGFKL
jgi:Mg-chelatase subunit ChlD